jgi:hypothetical protein
MTTLAQVPKYLYPSHAWLEAGDNRDNLRAFLTQHALDIATVQVLQFNEKSIEAQVLVREGDGFVRDPQNHNRFLVQTVTVPYVEGLKPKILLEGRRGPRQ